jgi:hypothetical protein
VFGEVTQAKPLHYRDDTLGKKTIGASTPSSPSFPTKFARVVTTRERSLTIELGKFYQKRFERERRNWHPARLYEVIASSDTILRGRCSMFIYSSLSSSGE